MNWGNKKYVWHIGFNKAGSTTLQELVFPGLAHLHVGKLNYVARSEKGLNEFVSSLHKPWSNFTKVGRNYRLDLESQYPGAGSVLLSHENILRPSRMTQTLMRLQGTFPSSAALVVFRPPREMLASWLWHRGYRSSLLPTKDDKNVHLKRGCVWPYRHSLRCSCWRGTPPFLTQYWNLGSLLRSGDAAGLPILAVRLESLLAAGSGPNDETHSSLQTSWHSVLGIPFPSFVDRLPMRNAAKGSEIEYKQFIDLVSLKYKTTIEQLNYTLGPSDALVNETAAAMLVS